MRIGFVTCVSLPEPDVDESLLLTNCAEAGIETALVPWDDPTADLTQFDHLVIRSTWNYYEKQDEFLQWLATAESQVPVWNHPDVVRWNFDKRYLLELSERGIPVVPTQYVSKGEYLDPALAWAHRIVIKPTVSAGSWHTRVFEREDPDATSFMAALLNERDVMVQPFLESVHTVGERSVMWVGGEVTHVVVKKPRFAGGDESVEGPFEPTDYERELLDLCIAPFRDKLLYARLDLIQNEAGEWLVSELELIEPSLFLLQSPAALDKLVAALGKLGS